MKYKFLGMTLAVMILLSMYINSCPLVFANVYVAGYHRMPPDLPYDVTCDGKIDTQDTARVSAGFGSLRVTDPSDPKYGQYWHPTPRSCCPHHPNVDVNDDGKIDVQDLARVISKFGSVESPSHPFAYSTVFNFSVPEDGDDEVHYYVYARVYVPSELSGQQFYLFPTSVNDWILNVNIDLGRKPKYNGSVNDPPCSPPASISLGNLGEGYHLLEFEFVEKLGWEGITFHVATASGPYAWLARFRTYVPNYSDNKIRYTVKTQTYFPGDDFFLGGFADDFIDDVYVDVGLLWQDWMWDIGSSYGAIYAWGDGFMYPLRWQTGWHDIKFTLGNNVTGLLDFQYISWTNQRDKIGHPRFYAVGDLHQAANEAISNVNVYGGSKWKEEDDPEFSERYFDVREVFDSSYNNGDYMFNASLEAGLGIGWAEWVLLPASMDDFGITFNLTSSDVHSNKFVGCAHFPDEWYWWEVSLENTTTDIYSFPALELGGMEFQEHDSFVTSGLVSAIDYIGTGIMFVSSAIEQPEGALVGFSIKGIAAILKIYEGQEVCRYERTITENDHYRLRSLQNLVAYNGTGDSDVIFLKLNPARGKHCGLVEVTSKSTLKAKYMHNGFPEFSAPIADLEITVAIPWFLRG